MTRPVPLARRLAPILAAGALAGALQGAEPVSPPAVEYTIQASLDAAAHVVDGQERLVWRNPSAEPVGELRFHLYLNAFKNNRSTFFRESGGQLRGDRFGAKPEDWGWIDISSFKTADGVDLKPSMRFAQPDGNEASDETVLAVTLPAPVPPHGEIALAIAFRSKLPRVFARTGYVRDFHLVGQWFPKIGVYEPAGMRGRAAGGWNCHAFHANSEFYADYGRYDVTLTAPAAFVVGATGKRVSENKRGDRATYQYVAENVHDFAWTADPRYAVHEFRFDPQADVPAGWTALAAGQLGLTPAAIALKPVSVRLLLQPGHERARDRYVQSTRAALSFYGLWFGAYPYETLTVVDPPEDGLGAGGMEYPTFITGEAHAWILRWPFARVRFVEDVNIHEFGHQYWYGMVGSNEFEESWLDEGLNTDSEYRAMELAYGPRVIDLPGGIGADLYSIAHGAYSSLPNLDPIRRHAWGFASGASYGVNSYMKVGLFMSQLRNDLGAGTFARAQRAYFEQWSFRHPSTADFFDVFEKVSGRDLSTYRRNLVEGVARLDWSVVTAKTDSEPKDSGVFERAGGRVTYEKGRQVKPREEKEKKDSPGEKKMFSSEVLFGNRGDWLHGARARLVFEDGKVLDRVLPEDAQWVRLRIRYTSKLAWAAVDPDRSNTWDWNRLNDSIVLGRGKGAADTAGSRAAVKYFAKASYLIGLFLQAVWTLA
jgi:hypothetical protein